MRQVLSRYATQQKPALTKARSRASTQHISPPSEGLSTVTQTTAKTIDTATVLTNFTVDEDRISIRAGYVKMATMPGGKLIAQLVPYYGTPPRLAAATNGTLCDAQSGTVWRSGFTEDHWSWTAFSDLGEQDYTVMCNGKEGVWGWDGGIAGPVATPVPITKIEKTNPARCTVAASDIGKFHDGMTVLIAGADATHAKANGFHQIALVGSVANTFVLAGVDLSGAAADQTTGAMTATLQGSFEKLAIYPPEGNTWLSVDNMQIVVAHMNRLWFADDSNLAVWYLPLQQRGGELSVIPLNSIFKRGGTIRALATWSVDGGMGPDDQLVIFTTNGECAIYSGVDPDTDLGLVGVYRMEPPMSRSSVINYGGELYVLIPTGVTPMTSMLRAGKEGVEMTDTHVKSIFLQDSIVFREESGWELFLNPSSGRLFANIPKGGGRYEQMIRHMPKPVWSMFQDVPAHTWAWMDAYVYFGDDLGNVYRMHPQYLNDDGAPIRVDVQMAWSQFKTANIKQFKMVMPYIVTNGEPRPFLEVKTDYKDDPMFNQPEITALGEGGAEWDVATWNEADWTNSTRSWYNWSGVTGLGRIGALRLSAQISDCSFAVTGWDVLWEEGVVI